MGRKNERAGDAESAARAQGEGGVARTSVSESGRSPRGSGSTGKKHARTLAGLGCAFLVAVIIVACVQTFGQESEETDTAVTESFLSVSTDEVQAIEWTYNGDTSNIEQVDGAWSSQQEPEATVDQSAAAALAQAVADASITRSLSSAEPEVEADTSASNGTDTSSATEGMGLDDPTVQVTVTLTDGSTVAFDLGFSTSDGSGCYAARTSDDAVFVVDADVLEAFSCTVLDLYEQESAPGASDITSLAVTTNDDKNALTLRYNESGFSELYTSQYTWCVEESGSVTAADTTTAKSLVSTVNNVAWTSCVDPVCEDASAYGFESPTLVATLDYTVETTTDTDEVDEDGNTVQETTEEPHTFVLEVGAQSASGDYYARPQGSTSVYTMAAEDVESLLEASAESLTPDDVCLMDWDTVLSIDITCDGQTKTVTFDRTTEGEGDEVETTLSYTVDGEEADTSAVEAFLDAIDALEAESEVDAVDSSAETGGSSDAAATFELVVTFHRDTQQFDGMTLGFSRYDNSFYLSSLDGESRLLVNRNDISELKELFAQL